MGKWFSYDPKIIQYTFKLQVKQVQTEVQASGLLYVKVDGALSQTVGAVVKPFAMGPTFSEET